MSLRWNDRARTAASLTIRHFLCLVATGEVSCRAPQSCRYEITHQLRLRGPFHVGTNCECLVHLLIEVDAAKDLPHTTKMRRIYIYVNEDTGAGFCLPLLLVGGG